MRTHFAFRPAGRPGRTRQSGFTLIELMVSLVIGFAVVGALLAAYLASARSGSHNDAMVQMAEDATQALNVIRTQAAMTGYAAPNGVTATGMTFNAVAPALFGCSQANFGDLTVGSMAPAACTGSSTSDTLEVAYEATNGTSATSPSNAIVNSAGVPLDCLGNTIPAQAGGYYINDSKFYVSGGALNCHAAGATPGAPLVDNVESLRITYGMAANGTSSQIDHYVTAAPAPGSNDWAKVVAVTICVQVRSANKVLDTTSNATLSTYVDCANTKQTSTDSYLRRTFSTTVVLQNKLL